MTVAAGGCLTAGVDDLGAADGKTGIDISPDVIVAADGCLTEGMDNLGAAGGKTGIGGGGGRVNCGLVPGTWGLAVYLYGMTGLGALALGDIAGRSLT